jgi:hypothetical protein
MDPVWVGNLFKMRHDDLSAEWRKCSIGKSRIKFRLKTKWKLPGLIDTLEMLENDKPSTNMVDLPGELDPAGVDSESV